MRPHTDREKTADAILAAGEGEGIDAWTLEDLDDDLGSLRAAFEGTDDVGG